MLEIENIDKIYKFKPINLNSGIDRYGFSDILANELNLHYRRRSFANWLHGWIWWKATSSTELMFKDSCKSQSRLVVSNFHEKEILKNEGFKNIWIGGLPFTYVKNSNFKRKPNSLLAMPPHSAENEKIRNEYYDYLDYLESIKNEYENVYVSIYYLDKSKEIIKKIESRGLKFIDGARPDDINSLRRMRAIFDSFEFITSNTMGSHIIYAIYCGCKTSLCGPMYKYDETLFLGNDGKINHDKKYVEDSLYYLSQKYLMEKFQFLYTQTPINGYFSEEYGKKEIGYYNKMNKEQILDALQWHLTGQVNGYSSGAIRRLKRIAKLL